MRFKEKKKRKPNEGQTKNRTKFAFFPVRIDNYTIWLEKYTQIYKYEYHTSMSSFYPYIESKYLRWNKYNKILKD